MTGLLVRESAANRIELRAAARRFAAGFGYEEHDEAKYSGDCQDDTAEDHEMAVAEEEGSAQHETEDHRLQPAIHNR